MNVPLPAVAFPIGGKAGATATFVTAMLIGLAFYLAARNKEQPKTPSIY